MQLEEMSKQAMIRFTKEAAKAFERILKEDSAPGLRAPSKPNATPSQRDPDVRALPSPRTDRPTGLGRPIRARAGTQ